MIQRLKHICQSQPLFLALWLIIVVSMSTALGTIAKQDLHLALNINAHSAGLDLFMMYFTKVAEYAPYIVVVILLFYSYDWAITAALGQLGATLTTQIIKYFINAPRPKTFFETTFPDMISDLHWVEGVNMHSWLSFPSGHTTAFFSMFFLLSLLIVDRLKKSNSPTIWLLLTQILCFALAALGGYSRIYLSQHFTSDVLAGCIIGVLLTSIFYAIPWQWNQPWSNQAIGKRK